MSPAEPLLPPPLKILFVCSQNKLRSLTAEKLYENFFRYHVKSAGTAAGARIRVTAGLIGWADRIFAMEKNHVRLLRRKYPEQLAGKRLVCLHIPDDYTYMDPDLIRLLKARLAGQIDVP